MSEKRKAEDYRKRQRREREKIMLEGIISGSQDGVQEKASCSK